MDSTISASQKITPFLWFDGKTEEAVKFYTGIFKNSSVKMIKRFPDDMPGLAGKVMTATFMLDGVEFMALDGGPQFKFTEAISFFVHCKTQEEVDWFWENLSKGGQVQRCGWLKDRYGVAWQIIPDTLGQLLGSPDHAKAIRVMEAMMKMEKIEIRILEEA
jgi:predicted 3-demethylubiquinone-9 3-methyltransferase (glyoxalase superfamily)